MVGARSRVAERAVIVGATPSSLMVNIPDWSKREGTSIGKREREPEKERGNRRVREKRKEKMKREEKEKGI